MSIKKRKLVEEIFGWSKNVGGLRKARFIGLAKVRALTMVIFAAYNLTRMATIFGWSCRRWWDSAVQDRWKALKSAKNQPEKWVKTGF